MSIHLHTLRPPLTGVGIIDGKVTNRELLVSKRDADLS